MTSVRPECPDLDFVDGGLFSVFLGTWTIDVICEAPIRMRLESPARLNGRPDEESSLGADRTVW